VARWAANDRSGSWRSPARDASGVARALTQLGKRIRALRVGRKLTQEQAAELAKIDGKHWQDIEGARTNPTAATLVGVARALEVALRELFEVSTDEETPRARGSGRAGAQAGRAGAQAGPAKARPRAKRRTTRAAGERPPKR
jgi:transcriptional regulator with XRE-family HTH domain